MAAGRELPTVTKDRNYPQPVKHLKPAALTGEPAPERRSADIEEKTGQGGEIVNNVGSIIADAGASLGQSISVAGDLVSLGVDGLQLYRMARNRERRAAAKAAWYPVLRGVRPWYKINAAEEAPLEAPGK